MVAGSNPAVPTPCGATGRRHWPLRIIGRLRRALDTIYLLIGILGFFAMLAIFFFGGFLLLDFIFGRRGGDL